MAVIGLKYLVVAPIISEQDGTEPTYGKGMKVGHLMKADLSWNRGDAKLFGDNVLVERDNSITDGTLAIGTTYLSPEGRQMMLGETTFGTTEEGEEPTYVTNDDPAPYVGTGFVTQESADQADTEYMAWWYWKVQYGMDESAETRGETVNYQTPEMSGNIVAVRPDAELKNRFRKFKKFTKEIDAINWVKAQGQMTA